MTSTRSLDARKRAGYGDFFAAIADLKATAAELRRLVKPAKHHRLLTEGRVRIVKCELGRGIAADVRGESGTYRVTIVRDGGLIVRSCTCEHGQHHPVKSGCSHVKAVAEVFEIE